MAIRNTLSASVERQTEQGREIIKENWFTYLLLTPVFLFIITLLWLPFLRGVWMSFHEWPLIGDSEWVGFRNYIYLLNWSPFWTGVWATVVYASIVVFQLALALLASLLVSSLDRLKWLVTGVFLIPYTMPPVVTGNIWRFILHPTHGMLFHYLTQWGILEEAVYWSSDGTLALIGVMFAGTWTFWPFMFLILTATLDNIPSSYYESAQVYGANRLQRLTRITLPKLKTAILIVVSLRMIWNLAKVSQVIQMTDGGPGWSTSILAVILYRMGVNSGSLGQAYAVGLILLALLLGFVFLFIREFESTAEEIDQ